MMDVPGVRYMERTDILDHVPFSDEQFYRLMQNCSIDLKSISTPFTFESSRYDNCVYVNKTVEEVSQLLNLASQLHNRFDDQFKHNAKIRRVCPNPNCKSKYAYFYEDFLYCPKCGTELVTTRDDRKDLENEF